MLCSPWCVALSKLVFQSPPGDKQVTLILKWCQVDIGINVVGNNPYPGFYHPWRYYPSIFSIQNYMALLHGSSLQRATAETERGLS